jgi:F0F1-type ATP synthase membrane subunit c/vacuolar-type H+-ATPase subunit K
MPTSDHHSIDQFLRTTTLICLAILAAVPIYCVVAYLAMSQSPDGFVSDVPQALAWILAAIAVAQIPIAAAVSGSLKKSAGAKASATERLAGWRTATVVVFALRESTAVIGLVITFLTGDLRWCFGLGALAVIAMLTGWPRRSEVERMSADPATAPIG